MHPAGTRTETFRFERPVETRNTVGEVVQGSWTTVARRRGSCEQTAYTEATETQQTIGQASYLIVCPTVDGLDGSCRIVWESRGGRLLYIASVVGDRFDPEQTIIASERRT